MDKELKELISLYEMRFCMNEYQNRSEELLKLFIKEYEQVKNCSISGVINWVDIKTSKPSAWGNYFVCLENDALFIANYSEIGNERWLVLGVGDIEEENPVKYWAKLPNPPSL